MSMPTAASPSVRPHSFQSWATFSAWACSSSALVGMQPQFRQVPPEGRRAFDDGGREPELRGADGGDVAAGAGADHDDVVFVRHSVTCLSSSWTRAGRRSWTEATRGPARAPARRGRRRGRAGRPATAAACSRSAAPSTTGSARRARRAWRRASGQRGERRRAARRPRRSTRTTTDVPYRTTGNSVKRRRTARQALATIAPTCHARPPKTVLICDDDRGCATRIGAILQARVPRPDGRQRRGGADAPQAGGRRPHPARRPAARHQRLRRAADRQGELQPRRSAS